MSGRRTAKSQNPVRRSNRLGSISSAGARPKSGTGPQESLPVSSISANTQSTDCKQSTDPNMASETDSSKIDAILKSLQTISGDIKTLQNDNGGMRSDIQALTSEVNSFKASLSEVSNTANEALQKCESNSDRIDTLKSELQEVRYELISMKKENKQIKDRAVRAEAQDRRNNLVLEGFPEKEDENCRDIVMNILEKLIPGAKKSIKIERSHRLPSFKAKNSRSSRPRPIIFKFLSYVDRESVWKQRSVLDPTDMSIHADFPKEINERRRVLNPIARKARECGHEAYVSVDKLHVDDSVYTLDTVTNLPKHLQPSEVFTRRAGNYTAFFTKHSPLSNHYPSKFKLDGIEFAHVEQYFMYRKAVHCDDYLRTSKILETEDPAECKRIGTYSLKLTDRKVWEEERANIMYEGCRAKFMQNPTLKDYLKSTGETEIIECCKSDKYWSVGLGLFDPDVFVKTKHTGQNKLGNILARIRSEI